jgi:hypothetical protein
MTLLRKILGRVFWKWTNNGLSNSITVTVMVLMIAITTTAIQVVKQKIVDCLPQATPAAAEAATAATSAPIPSWEVEAAVAVAVTLCPCLVGCYYRTCSKE